MRQFQVGMMRRWLPWLTALLVLGALAVVWNVLRQFSLDQIGDSLRRLSAGNLALAALFTAGSYATLTGFDYLGVRYAGRRLPYRLVALASFTSLSIGHTVGLSPLSSGAVRYRFYSRYGLGPAGVAKVILFSAATVALGELSLAAVALLINAELAARILGVDPGTARLLGVAGLGLLGVYIGLAATIRPSITIKRWTFAWPSWRLALGQIAVGCANYALVAAALRAAIGPVEGLDYATVATAYILANLAALMSHVPGGLGVIEAVIVMLLPGASVIGGVIAFRVIYFLVPLALGVSVLIALEARIWLRRRGTGRARSAPATDSAR
jgi:uncharacterized membrane protein YbhN (UPF0104 family)